MSGSKEKGPEAAGGTAEAAAKKMGGLSKDEAMDIVHDTAKVKAFEEMMIKRNS